MASLEPSFVTVPVFRTDNYTAQTRVPSTFTTHITRTTTIFLTPAATASVSHSPSVFHTLPSSPPVASASASSLPLVHDSPAPPVTLIVLLSLAGFALVGLLVFWYTLFLCCRGKRAGSATSPRHGDDPDEHEAGVLERVSRAVVQTRPHTCDLEAVGSEGQTEQEMEEKRAESLARLEGKESHQRERTAGPARQARTQGDTALKRLRRFQLTRRVDSAQSAGSKAPADAGEAQEDVDTYTPPTPVQKPLLAYIRAPPSHDDDDPTLRNPDFSGTYDDYARDVVAPRERGRKIDSIVGWLGVASDPNTRESAAVRATAKASAKMADLDCEGGMAAVAPWLAGQSRFKERFSIATQSWHGSV